MVSSTTKPYPDNQKHIFTKNNYKNNQEKILPFPSMKIKNRLEKPYINSPIAIINQGNPMSIK